MNVFKQDENIDDGFPDSVDKYAACVKSTSKKTTIRYHRMVLYINSCTEKK